MSSIHIENRLGQFLVSFCLRSWSFVLMFSINTQNWKFQVILSRCLLSSWNWARKSMLDFDGKNGRGNFGSGKFRFWVRLLKDVRSVWWGGTLLDFSARFNGDRRLKTIKIRVTNSLSFNAWKLPTLYLSSLRNSPRDLISAIFKLKRGCIPHLPHLPPNTTFAKHEFMMLTS